MNIKPIACLALASCISPSSHIAPRADGTCEIGEPACEGFTFVETHVLIDRDHYGECEQVYTHAAGGRCPMGSQPYCHLERLPTAEQCERLADSCAIVGASRRCVVRLDESGAPTGYVIIVPHH